MKAPVKALCKNTIMKDDQIQFMKGNEYDITDYTPSKVTILSQQGLLTVPMDTEDFEIKYEGGSKIILL